MLDDIKEKAKKQKEKKEAEAIKRASDYHKAFVQNAAGKNVLDNWVRLYCMAPITRGDASLFECGIVEGKRQLVKEIMDNISFINNREG